MKHLAVKNQMYILYQTFKMEDSDEPLINKTYISQTYDYQCDICYNDYIDSNSIHCNRCVFQQCYNCYYEFNFKKNINFCPYCRL